MRHAASRLLLLLCAIFHSSLLFRPPRRDPIALFAWNIMGWSVITRNDDEFTKRKKQRHRRTLVWQSRVATGGSRFVSVLPRGRPSTHNAQGQTGGREREKVKGYNFQVTKIRVRYTLDTPHPHPITMMYEICHMYPLHHHPLFLLHEACAITHDGRAGSTYIGCARRSSCFTVRSITNYKSQGAHDERRAEAELRITADSSTRQRRR